MKNPLFQILLFSFLAHISFGQVGKGKGFNLCGTRVYDELPWDDNKLNSGVKIFANPTYLQKFKL